MKIKLLTAVVLVLGSLGADEAVTERELSLDKDSVFDVDLIESDEETSTIDYKGEVAIIGNDEYELAPKHSREKLIELPELRECATGGLTAEDAAVLSEKPEVPITEADPAAIDAAWDKLMPLTPPAEQTQVQQVEQ